MDILFFALGAAFIAYRVYIVLGKRTGHEPGNDSMQSDNSKTKIRPIESDNVVALPDRSGQASNDEVSESIASTGDRIIDQTLKKIHEEDPTFDLAQFLDGSRAAFEVIVTSFAEGDLDTLRSLINDSLFTDFKTVIQQRETANETLQTTFVGFRSSEILSAEIQEKMAFVTVKFISEQINTTYDESKTLIEGDHNTIEEITDIWTFSRTLGSKDPNWTLVATQSSQ